MSIPFNGSVRRPWTRRWPVALLSALFLAILVGCSADAKQEGSEDKAEGEKKDSLSSRLVPVEITPVSRGRIHDYIRLDGVVATESQIEVYSLVSGHVAELRVEAGDRVSAGDTLLVLADEEIVLEVERTSLEMQQAERDWERLQQLADKGLVSPQELDQSRTALDRATLNWKTARLAFERSRITAPIAGVVSERLVSIGAWIQRSNPLFRLLDDRELIAELDLPEKDLARIRPNLPVEVEARAAGEDPFRGWIKRISPVVDPTSGTIRVTVGIEDPQTRLRSGMYASFAIVAGTRENAVLIPKRSLLYERNRVVAFVVDDEDKAHRRVLQRGFEDEERIEVLSGIDEGEQLVLVGQNSLKDKSPVRVINEDPASGLADAKAPEAGTETADAGNTDSAE